MKNRLVLLIVSLLALVLLLSGCLSPQPSQYSISGYVKDSSGSPIFGVTISFSDGSQSVVTNSSGYWSKSGLTGSVAVTPSKNGWTFNPSTITVSGARSDVNFTGTKNNQPPNTPSNPHPYNGETNVSTKITLTWNCSDIDGDTLAYDVYFGTTSNPLLLVSNVSNTSYNPGTLSYSTKYYWKIVAKDGKGGVTPGPVWSFTTKAKPAPTTYTVSGYVKNSSGNAVSGVKISFSDGLSSVITDSQGHWSKSGLSGNVTVTPSLSGYTFSPSSITVSGARSDVNFTGTENVIGSLSIIQRWNLTTNGTPTAGQVYSSPAISPDGVVFIGGQQGLFFNFSSNGNYHFFQSAFPVWSAPVIDSVNNMIFVGNNKGQLLYSYSPFNTLYAVNVSNYSIISAPLVYNGNVYVVDHAGNIYEMSESSMSPYKIGSIGGHIWSSPVTNGTDMFIGSDNGTFYAVDLSSGNVNWQYSIGNPIYGTAAIDSSGNVYIGGTKLWSFTSSGTLRWSKQLDSSRIYGSPVISQNGVVYIGTTAGDFYAVDSNTGDILWSENLSTPIGGISSSAIIGDNGVVYVASGQVLWALDPGNGDVLSAVGLGYNVESSPVLNGGYIYIGCDDGYLYKIKALSSTIASNGWPMFMRDWYHTGMPW